MKRFVAWLCALMLMVGCIGDLTPVVYAADEAGESLQEASGGVTYYVSTNGVAGNDGRSEQTPFPGLAAVPWDKLMPGDSVLLKKGDVFPGFIRLVDVHGEAGNPVAIGAYGEGAAPRVEAGGQGIWLQEAGSTASVGKYASAGVLLYDCSYVTVSGLAISNKPAAMKASFTDANGTNHSAEDALRYSGVAVAADGIGSADGIVLADLTVHDTAEAVVAETSSTVTQTNVAIGAASMETAPVKTSGTYYVSSLNGSDSYDGSSPDTPFYSLHKINAMELGPGAKVYLERGSVFEDQFLHIEGSGAEGAPIVIDAYGADSAPRPLINTNGQGVWYQNFGKNLDNSGHVRHGFVSSCVSLYDVEYIEVRNLAMTNGGDYGQTVTTFDPNTATFPENQVDGGTVPGETGYSSNGNVVGSYTWGGKMSRTGVSGIAQNKGTVEHVYLQNLDIEKVYGNVYYKHMNNGGIYFTVSYPANEAATGIPKFDDLRIEGCYLRRVSRWGIAAAYTAYWQQMNAMAISDEVCQKYGSTNLYIGHNYLEEVGGDPITTMYDFKPLVEYNVAVRGAREIISAVYHNGTAPNGNKGTVAAGIWPWKCKTALFEHNECYDMMHGGNGNNDAEAWDADYGDSTIYQYNYSSGNTGGCVMYCAAHAYNTVFRYNISYKDGKVGGPGSNIGALDFATPNNGQMYNNTFLFIQGAPAYHRNHGGTGVYVQNNIFYNTGSTAYDPGWTNSGAIYYDTNIYSGFSSTGNDANPIVLTDAERAALFAGDVDTAPTAPKTSSKNGAGVTATGIRSWTYDWDSDFDMFKLGVGAEKAVNAGLPHSYTGLTQDSSFGVAQVPVTRDFYGNDLDGTPDIGAFDTGTYAELPVSSENELKASLYELRNGELQVPYTDQNQVSLEQFVAGLTVSDGAAVKVYNGAAEVTSGNVAAGMTVKIVAEDGTENATVYTIRNKNSYNHKTDFVASQQGNVWFHQVRRADNGELINLTSFAGGAQGWWTGGNNTCAEYNGAADDDTAARQYAGSGFVFRAPVTGRVTISFPEQPRFRYPATAFSNSFDTYVRVYLNGRLLEGMDVQVPRPVSSTAAAVAADIPSVDITVAQGDTIEFMVVNSGEFTSAHVSNSADVLYNVAVQYKDEAVTELPDDTKAPSTPGNVRSMEVTETSALIKWSASTDNRGVTGYKISVNGAEQDVGMALEYMLTGLNAGTEYTVTVIAYDAAGNQSGAGSVVFRTANPPEAPDTTAPTVPTGGETVGVTQTTATIRWTASTDDTGVAGYVVGFDGRTEIIRNTTRYTLTGLTAGTEYAVTIKAFDAAGNESGTLSLTVTTAAPDTTAPTVPGGLTVLGIVQGGATVRWTASTDDVGVMGYEVRVNGDAVQDVGNVLQYILTDLTTGTEYTVSVRAYDEAGNRSDWAQASFTSASSSENSLLSSIFELRGSSLQVPYTENTPMSLNSFVAGLSVPDHAVVKVYDGDTEVTGGNVAEGMTVRIVAQNGAVNPTVYTIQHKNEYNGYNDWMNNQQGNVWFYQYEQNGQFIDHTKWDTQWNCWSDSSKGYISVERNQACGSINDLAGSGFTFRAPASGEVTVSFYNYKSAGSPVENQVQKRGDTPNRSASSYIRIFINGEELSDKAIPLPKTTEAVAVQPMTLTVDQGDTLSFMVRNEGSYTSMSGNHGVYFTPVVTYVDVDPPVHTHGLTHVNRVEPTVEAEGNIEYWYCAGCGGYFSDADATVEITLADTVLGKLDPPVHTHGLTHVNRVEPTVEAEGNIEYWYCAECGRYFSDADATVEITLADTVLGKLDPPVHTHGLTHVNRVEPTVEAEGNIEYWYCAECGRYFSDADATVEITLADTVLGKLDPPVHTHGLTHVNRVEPTVEAEGNIEYWYCTECGGYFSNADATVQITEAETILHRLPDPVNPAPPVVPVLPVVPEIIIPVQPGPDEEIEEPDTPLADLPFVDVDHEEWYAQSIANVVARGLMEGVDALLFAPEEAMTRGMMAQALYALAQKPEVTNPAFFLDLADGVNYADAVAWGAETGVIKGYSETEFGGEDALNRQQLATLLYRYAQMIDKQDVSADVSALEQFFDHDRVSAWAEEALAWAVANELVIGRTDGTLDPRATISRAEAAAILDRYYKQFLA